MIVKFTHLWVTDFGWEPTIYQESDFELVDKLGWNAKDGYVFIGHTKETKNILKGYYE